LALVILHQMDQVLCSALLPLQVVVLVERLTQTGHPVALGVLVELLEATLAVLQRQTKDLLEVQVWNLITIQSAAVVAQVR
jgi:general stress protein CsbA